MSLNGSSNLEKFRENQRIALPKLSLHWAEARAYLLRLFDGTKYQALWCFNYFFFFFPPSLLAGQKAGKSAGQEEREEKGNEAPPQRPGMHRSVFGLVPWVFVLASAHCCAGQGINNYAAHGAFSHPLLQNKPRGNLRLLTLGSLAGRLQIQAKEITRILCLS